MAFFKQVLSGDEKGIIPSCLRGVAWLASKPYGAAARARNLAYDKGWFTSYSVSVPVISIGNLTVGGTGKTPAVAMVCRYLRDHGLRVSIISRGYGAVDGGLNDEALELELQLPDVPHIQNPDRLAAATIAIEELDTQIIVMDDGFQHRRMRRDLDIVLLDATEPFGYEHILPRGLLREQVSSLKRAGIVIATRADQVEDRRLASMRLRMQRYATNCGWCESIHKPRQLRNSSGHIQPLSMLDGRRCLLFCGIGNPNAFAHSVKSCGASIYHLIEFPDHHPYSAVDISTISAEVDKAKLEIGMDQLALLCTGKDLGKINLDEINGIPLYALEVGMELRFGNDAFQDRMKEVINAAFRA